MQHKLIQTNEIFKERCVVNNVIMSSLRAPRQNGPYKNKQTKQHKNTQNTKTQQTFRKKLFCVFLTDFEKVYISKMQVRFAIFRNMLYRILKILKK